MNKQVTLSSTKPSLTESIFIDSTLGDDTKIVVSYTVDIDVNVTTPQNNTVDITKDANLKLITVSIGGRVVSSTQWTPRSQLASVFYQVETV